MHTRKPNSATRGGKLTRTHNTPDQLRNVATTFVRGGVLYMVMEDGKRYRGEKTADAFVWIEDEEGNGR